MKLNVVIVVVALFLSPSLGASNETQGFGENTISMLVPPTAAPTNSPAPTAPTASPTDSPVPSPSPSETPSGVPTGTPRPTGSPTESPTDSPVPSPSPSVLPSEAPSASPSFAPSKTPSSAPSNMPSSSPSLSVQPSSAPSVSSMPSSKPSLTPTSMPSSEPSGAPSSEPSAHSVIMSTLVSVTLQDLITGLSGHTLEVFQEQAAEFVQSELPKAETMGVRVNISSVKVVEQKIVLGDNDGNATRRFLQESGLHVRMDVTGEIFSGDPPDDFDFASLVSMGFAKNYLIFIYRLGSADPFFNQLLGGAPNPFIKDTNESSNKNEKGATAGIVIGCMAAVAIAIAAAMYAFRLRDKKSGLKKPGSIVTGNGDNFCLEQSDSHSSCMTPYDQAYPDFKSPTSPNTLENGGKSTRLGISRKESKTNVFSPTETVQSERFAGLGIRVPTRTDTDQDQMGAYCATIPLCGFFGTKCKREEETSLYDIGGRRMGAVDPNVPKEVDTSNLIVPRPMTKTMSEPIATRKKDPPSAMHKSAPTLKTIGEENSAMPHKKFPSTTRSLPIQAWRNDEDSLDEKLMKHVNIAVDKGEYDPQRTSRGSANNDDYVSDDESVLLEKATTEVAAFQTGGFACGAIPGFPDMSKMAGGFLGARRMDLDEQVQYKERTSDEALRQKRTGLYDIYAPPGPLGIVVDTSKDGPVIHSMKASSTLLGLAGAGDLIVGLDDMDTRSMTAATLTRLMAKRAHQPERKLTLLAKDK